jgi:uncharacterized secreted protein with C-terminal beta-propeller domain
MKTCVCFLSAFILALTLAVSASEGSKPPKNAARGIKSINDLAKLLAKQKPQQNYGGAQTSTARVGTLGNVAGPLLSGSATPQACTGASDGTPSFSSTNDQVAGVDEADIVKTDGQYIYYVQDESVLIINAYPASGLAVTSTIGFNSDFYPQGLFIAGNFLAVIGSSYSSIVLPMMGAAGDTISGGTMVPSTMIALPDIETVNVLVYDVTDKCNPVLARQIQADGFYLAAREIGNIVYLVTRDYPEIYAVPLAAGTVNTAAKAKKQKQTSGLAPRLLDTAVSSQAQEISLPNIVYFPGFAEPDYVVITAFDMTQAQTPANTLACLGAGELVYASAQNLYVTDSQYDISATATAETTCKTVLYKFALNNGQVTAGPCGAVSGTVLDQFSLDEQDGNLRVATSGANSNNVYVLNSGMNLLGKLEGLAPGEQITAARFIGCRCYLTTSLQADPLFVIDLSEPANPAVLGKLQMSGYTTYLQPYDDTHLIGFGLNTGAGGSLQGMQLALYDVSDVNNPVQMYTVSCGDWSGSEALYDHNALLFAPSLNLLAFPVWAGTVAAIAAANGAAVSPVAANWFDGAYVYQVTLDNGFVLEKVITHYPSGQQTPYSYGLDIQRILYIGNDLYTLSECEVMANNLNTYNEDNDLTIGTPGGPLPAILVSGN